MKKLVILLAGGFSEEREISLKSSDAINKGLQQSGYNVKVVDPAEFSSYPEMGSFFVSMKPYCVFNGLHGGDGENGTIQAYLSLLKIPFTGSGVTASAIAMDKIVSSHIADSLGLKIPSYFVVHANDKSNIIQDTLGYPLVIKPSNSGSSYGVTIVNDEDDLPEAMQTAFRYSNRVICQKFISGSELTVSILGEKALPVVEIKVNKGWYDYQNKYTKGNTDYIVPAKIQQSLTRELQLKSELLFKEIGCRGYGRVDFRYDGKDCYFLELNTLPGMTSLSLTPMAAAEAGISFPELIEKIIIYSIE